MRKCEKLKLNCLFDHEIETYSIQRSLFSPSIRFSDLSHNKIDRLHSVYYTCTEIQFDIISFKHWAHVNRIELLCFSVKLAKLTRKCRQLENTIFLLQHNFPLVNLTIKPNRLVYSGLSKRSIQLFSNNSCLADSSNNLQPFAQWLLANFLLLWLATIASNCTIIVHILIDIVLVRWLSIA